MHTATEITNTSVAHHPAPRPAAPAAPQKSRIRTYGKGTHHTVNGVHVLHLKGSFHEMGVQHGALLRDEIRRGAIPYYRSYVERLMGKSQLGATSKIVIPALQALVGKQVERAMPAFAVDTIRGLAEGAGIPFAEFMGGCTLPDTLLWVAARLMELKAPGPAVVHRLSLGLGCTSAIAWGDATKDGKLLHARNLDYHGVGNWPSNTALLFHTPDEGMRYVSVSSAGVGLGGVTAMNEAGLTLTVHQHMFTDTTRLGGTPIGTVGDIVMRTAKNLDEAEAILRAHTSIGCWTYLITDGKSREVLCFEESPVRQVSRRVGGEASTFGYANVYLDEELGSTEVNLYGSYWRHNEARHRRANQLLTERAGTLDPAGMASIVGDRGHASCRLSEAIAMVMTVGSVVFSPEDGQVWVGTGEAPTSRGEWLCFSLRDNDLAEGKETFRLADDETEIERQAFEHYRKAYVAYLDELDVHKALKEMDAARQLCPEQALFHYLAGLSALELGDAPSAKERLDRAVALGHPHPERRAAFHLWRGRAHDRLGDRKAALLDYRLALATPSDPGVLAAAKAGHRKPYRARAMNIDFSMGDVVQP